MCRARLLPVVLLAACGPTDASGPLDVWIVARLPGEPAHRLAPRRIESLASLAEVRGPATTLKAGGGLKVKPGIDRLPRDADEYRSLMWMDGGEPPVAWFTERDDGWLPEDYHSLAMASFYHHVEAARGFFVELGVDPDLLDSIPTWYTPKLPGSIWIPIPVLTDNAGYVPTLNAFVLFERALLGDLPLPLNQLVVTHEYSHAVAERLLNGSEGAPGWIRLGWSNRAANAQRSLDEGIADFMAALHLGEPDLLRESVPGKAEERRLDVVREMESRDESSLGGAPERYDPYPVGSVIASALWALSGDDAGPEVGRAVLAALEACRRAEEQGPFYLQRFFEGLLDELSGPRRAMACTLLTDRFGRSQFDPEAAGCP